MDTGRAMTVFAFAWVVAGGVGASAFAAFDAGTAGLEPLPGPIGRMAEPERAQTGNPLWAIPLSSLTATRERPIFLPSRRPPAPAVAGPPPAEPVAPPPPPAERPSLTLIGAVIGQTESIAIFLDPAREAIRLRTGQDYRGWVLNAVRNREAVLQKDDDTAIFALPPPGAATTASIPFAASPAPGLPPVARPAAPGLPGPRTGEVMVVPSTVGSFAPFIPRHTPKNGESDGL
jgi:general secretion pathway protein N